MKKIVLLVIIIINVCLSSIFAQNLHRAVPDGRVDSVQEGINLPMAYTGKDVIIGFTDWGFDYTHPVFYDTLMTEYRILRAWDQFRNGGPAPEGFNYGTELIGQQQLLAAQCDTSNVYGRHYHATHAASIAGGAGAGTQYRGVAPDANFLFVSFLVNEQAVIDAFHWMFNVAQQEQKRLVINMSWGLYYMDNLDGTGRIAQTMNELSEQGVVFVTSGGNNGDENFHLGHTFSGESDTLRSQFLFSSDYPNMYGQSLSMTNSPQSPFSIALNWMDNSYNTLMLSDFYETAAGDNYIDTFMCVGTDTVFYNIEITAETDVSLRPEVRLRVKKPTNTTWKMGITVVADTGEFHAWNLIELTTDVGNWGAAFAAPQTGWTAGDKNYGLGTPANVDCAITVAAHQSRYLYNGSWRGGTICDFSSYGPTIDQRPKPEISAPGYNVVSAISSFTDNSVIRLYPLTFDGRTYHFSTLSGTSMSSPFVAGVVALILQANPNLSPNQVKEVLTETARQDDFTQAFGAIRFGAGKVNAYQAILKALELVGCEEFTITDNRYSIFPNPTNDCIYISAQNDNSPTTAELYNLNGQLLQRTSIFSCVNKINLGQFPTGCYLLKIENHNYQNISKIIKAQ